MGYYSKRHGEQAQSTSVTSQGRSYYRERHQAEIPPTESILQRALKQGVKTAGVATPFLQTQPVYSEANAMRNKGIEGVTKNPLLRFGLGMATDPMTYASASGVGQIAKEVTPAVKGVGKFLKQTPSNIRLRSELGKSGRIQNVLQGALEKRRYNLGTKFGKTLSNLTDSNPDRTVSGVKEALSSYAENPEVGKVLERLPSSKSILSGGETVSEAIEGRASQGVNVREVQRLINELEERFPFKKPGETSVFDLEGRRLIGELRDLQSSAFPEMKGARAKFRQGAEAYKTVRGKLASKTPENEIRRGFGAKGRVKEAAQEALPPSANKLIKRISSADKVVRAGKTAGVALPVFGGGVAAWKLLNSSSD